MGQQVNRSSKVKSLSESDWTIIKYVHMFNKKKIVMDKLLLLDPKLGDLSKTRL